MPKRKRIEQIEPTSFEVPYKNKTIQCEKYGDGSAMTFTHGAGGGIDSPATRDFVRGFSTKAPVTVFAGNMNLKSRVAMFEAVSVGAAGGRSMGARAACHMNGPYVLVSYPLIGADGDRRDELLHGKDDVLFVIGDKDRMCPLDELNAVRDKMGRTWLIEVEGADHGMKGANVQKTGELAAMWLLKRPKGRYMLLKGDEGEWE